MQFFHKIMPLIIVNKVTKCTTSNEQGTLLYDRIFYELQTQNSVTLSFKDVKIISSSFLNSSIGALFDNIGPDNLKDKIRITHYNPNIGHAILNYVNNKKQSFLV